jgi:UDP-N-acetylmuramate--alanine ligase
MSAFEEFTGLVPDDGLLLVNAHDRSALAAARDARCRLETFGIGTSSTWTAEDLRGENALYSFDVLRDGAKLGRIRLVIPGVHNVLNALAATATALNLGVDFVDIQDALASFHGAARRFHTVGCARGVTVVDDYAHHPTEIRVTLKAAREGLDAGRLWVVFQPHQYSRTRFFLKDFARSFSLVDHIIVPDIYFVRDSDQERKRVSAEDLVSEMVALGCQAEYIPGWEMIVERIVSQASEGDVVITMGAGNINEVAYALLERLQSDS